MHIEDIRAYCLAKKAVTESFPFEEFTQTVLVFKVMDKMFLLTDLNDPSTINVKCDPEYAIELREKYEEVTGGYHMNKKYWNTVEINGSLSDKQILSFIDHSYEQVVAGMTKRKQKELETL